MQKLGNWGGGGGGKSSNMCVCVQDTALNLYPTKQAAEKLHVHSTYRNFSTVYEKHVQ